MLEVLVTVQSVALLVGVPLLSLWLQERVKNLAREASDKVLQDYRHEHEKELAALEAQHQRQLTDFSLFTQKRHEVYGALYRRVRMAADLYGSMLWISSMPDFARYSLEDAIAYCDFNKVSGAARRNVLAAFEPGSGQDSAKSLQDLHHLVERRIAQRHFVKAKSIEALHEVYLSDDVRDAMQEVRSRIARVSVLVEHETAREREDENPREEMLTAVQQLLRVMRDEIQRDTGKSLARAV